MPESTNIHGENDNGECKIWQMKDVAAFYDRISKCSKQPMLLSQNYIMWHVLKRCLLFNEKVLYKEIHVK